MLRDMWELVKSQRRTRGTFMSVLSNESLSHYRCAEATLPFSAVAKRLLIVQLRNVKYLLEKISAGR